MGGDPTREIAREWTVRTRSVEVLGADPDLGERIPAEQLAQARAASRAQVVDLLADAWNAGEASGLARDGFGLLVCTGMLVRRVGREQRYGAELLGPGDVLRPWEHDGEDVGALFETHWQVPEPTRLLVLDEPWATRMAPWPAVATALCGRAVERSRRMAVMTAITRHRHVRTRLLLLLWELADMRGRVRPDGIWLELPLTHETLGQIIGARRPPVTMALGELREAGRIRAENGGYLLLGERPEPGRES